MYSVHHDYTRIYTVLYSTRRCKFETQTFHFLMITISYLDLLEHSHQRWYKC